MSFRRFLERPQRSCSSVLKRGARVRVVLPWVKVAGRNHELVRRRRQFGMKQSDQGHRTSTVLERGRDVSKSISTPVPLVLVSLAVARFTVNLQLENCPSEILLGNPERIAGAPKVRYQGPEFIPAL